MKIGPVDIGIPAIANLVGCVAAIVALFVLWNKGTDLRHEAFYRDKILRGLSDGLPERQAEGLSACRAFLAIEPNHIATRLTMANIYALQEHYTEAKQAFDDVVKLPKATPLEKAIALNGSGICALKGSPKEKLAAGVAEAEKLFQAAIESDNSYADAYANLAMLQPYKSAENWHAAAEGPARAALESKVPPTLESLGNVYRLMGVIQQQKKQPTDALKAFDASQAVRPAGAGGSEQMRRTTKLAGVIQNGLPAEVRRTQILEIERSINTLGERPQQSLAMTAVGIAWMNLREEADWATNGYPNAVRAFNRAIEYDPRNKLAYRNLSAHYDIQVDTLSKQLKGQVTSFNGITPPADVVKDGIKARRFLPADKGVLPELRRTLKDNEDVWRRFLEKSAPSDEDKTTATLEMIMLLRRQAYTMDVDEESTSKVTLDRALVLAKELETRAGDSGLVQFSVGMLLLDMKKYGEANLRFTKATEKGFKSETLTKLLTDLSRKPEMIGARPADGQRWFGTRPLVSATLYAPNATEGFKSIEMTHNGTVVPSMLLGSQVLYLPDASKLTDGRHKMQISVIEAVTSNKIEFPPLEFSIDRLPPSWKLLPDGGDVDGKAVFNITLSDPTGVDVASVRVLYRSMDNSKNPTNREIVISGRYKITAPDLNIKGNQSIAGDSFKVSAGSIPLPPGAYVLDIVAKDLSGNEMKASKGFQVK